VSTIVTCEHVAKSYSRRATVGLKEFLVGRRRRAGHFLRQLALDDVSFTLERGASLGVIGRNGSGKSTLLGLLLGVMRPDSGRIEIDGRLASLLALGAGFHPELTGRQNVFLHAAILGMTLSDTRARLHSIVAFSGLGDAVDHPIRTYSSGMVARLGFSCLVNAQADILLIDEVLAVGDLEFQRKCVRFLHDFRSRGGSLVIVTHDLGSVRRICDQAICLNEGRVVSAGAAEKVVEDYSRLIGTT
jgi:lipopolysaccharide transport system ATP-binding protein